MICDCFSWEKVFGFFSEQNITFDLGSWWRRRGSENALTKELNAPSGLYSLRIVVTGRGIPIIGLMPILQSAFEQA
jgi:hypothetical protein